MQFYRVEDIRKTLSSFTDDKLIAESKLLDLLNHRDEDVINHPYHYENHAITLQPLALCKKLGFSLGSAMKYCIRYQDKNNPMQDLDKAKRYVHECLEEPPLEPDPETIFLLREFAKTEPAVKAYVKGNLKGLLDWIKGEQGRLRAGKIAEQIEGEEYKISHDFNRQLGS